MDQSISQRQLAIDWMRIFLKEQKDLVRKHTRNTKELLDSFVDQVNAASDDQVTSVLLRYAMHLRYLDMGVGRGVPVGSNKNKADFLKKRFADGKLRKYNRKKVPVHNKPFTHQSKRFLELLTTNYALGSVQIVESVKLNGETKLNG